MSLTEIDSLDVWVSALNVRKSTGRGRSNSKTKLGIQALKKLVMGLAISGKLSEKNINDETSESLLQRISEHSKQSSFKRLNIENSPKHWAAQRLGALSNFQNGYAFKSKDYVQSGVGVVRIGDLQNGEISDAKLKYVDASVVSELKRSFKVGLGDLLIAMSGATTGKLAFNSLDVELYLNQRVGIIRPIFIDKHFLFLVLSLKIEENLSISAGSAIPNLSSQQIKDIVVPLPPIEEQKRIVTKVDELMKLIDHLEEQTETARESHAKLVDALLRTLVESEDTNALAQNWTTLNDHFETLFTTEESLEKLKGTVLDLAVRGKIVQNEDEYPQVNLNSVMKERVSKGVSSRFKKKNDYTVLPFDTPKNWVTAFLGNAMLKISDGTHHSPPNGEIGEYLYISAKNIKNRGVQTSNATYVSGDVHEEIFARCDPEKGDVLYIKDGATTGVGTINDLDEPFSMLSSVALLKPSAITWNKYILYLMRSPFFFDNMRSQMSGVAITRVTLKKLNEAIIPLPPLQEQKRIVTKVDELMVLCDELIANIRTSEALKVELAESVVHHASAS